MHKFFNKKNKILLFLIVVFLFINLTLNAYAQETSKCTYGVHIQTIPGYELYKWHQLEFNNPKIEGKPQYTEDEKGSIIIYPKTNLKVTDIREKFLREQDSDGNRVDVPHVDEPIGMFAIVVKGSNVINDIKNSRNTQGFFSNVPKTLTDITKSTKGFSWTETDLRSTALHGTKNSFGVYNFPEEGAYDFYSFHFNTICDAPKYICPVASNLCAIGSLAGDDEGMTLVRNEKIKVVVPKIEIHQETTPGYDTLIRLYENQRNISFSVNITNVGEVQVKVKAALDCEANLECEAITDKLVIDPGAIARFDFSIKPSNITMPPFNQPKMPPELYYAINPTIIVNASYPGLKPFETKAKKASITLVDQDWSKVFCENPNNEETGMINSGQGNLMEYKWLVDESDGYFTLGEGSNYKTCCGDDGIDDTWSNPSQNKGFNDSCFMGSVIHTCEQPEEEARAINDNGTIYICGEIPAELGNYGFTQNNACTLRCASSMFCSYDGSWKSTQDEEGNIRIRDTIKSWPPEGSGVSLQDPKMEKGCCEAQQCWNGSSCIESQSESTKVEIYNNYRCLDGEWHKAVKLCDINDICDGYCPRLDQCLVNSEGNPADNDNPKGDPQCIKTGQYIEDNYCEYGNWSSRTKLIALQLLNLPSKDYTLFCDNYENSLNYVEYLVGEAAAENYIKAENEDNVDKANNFCIITYDNKIVLGTSLNDDINNAKLPFKDVLGIENCEVKEGNNYYPCDNSKRVWYNNETRSVIYSKEAIALPTKFELLDSYRKFLKDPFTIITNTIHKKITKPPKDDSYLNATKRFDNIYLRKADNKEVMANNEGVQYKNAVIGYKNFQTNICNFVKYFKDFNQTYVGDGESGIVCVQDGNNYYVLAQGSETNNLNPDDIWTDLTSNLRIT